MADLHPRLGAALTILQALGQIKKRLSREVRDVQLPRDVWVVLLLPSYCDERDIQLPRA